MVSMILVSADGTPYELGATGAQGPQGIQGPKGDAGKDGTGVNIKGSYDTLAQLQTAHPTGVAGDAYLIGGNLYIWAENESQWVNVGNIRGPQGEQGPQGATGATGAQGETGSQGPKGDTGSAGAKGDTGAKGDKGDTGLTGPKGDTGAEGPAGAKGDKGDTGTAASISVGTVSTLDAGQNATVTNSGTSSAAVFNFGIPKGADGSGGSGGTDTYKRPATVVIGLEASGYTAKDVDILIPSDNINCISQLNAAVTAISSAIGGKILLLEGTYYFGSTWIIDKSGLTVEGVYGSTNLVMRGTRTTSASDANKNSVIYVSGSNNKFTGLKLTNGDSFATAPNGYSFGFCVLATNSVFTRNIVANGSTNGATNNCYGIQLRGSGNELSYNTIMNVASGGNCIGIGLGSTNNNLVANNIIQNADYSESTNLLPNVGIFISNANYNIIEGNYIVNTSTANLLGIKIDGSTGSPNSNIITGNIIGNGSQNASTNCFAIGVLGDNSYNQVINNNLSGSSDYYTTNIYNTAPIPGSPTTIAAFGTGGVCGFNMVRTS